MREDVCSKVYLFVSMFMLKYLIFNFVKEGVFSRIFLLFQPLVAGQHAVMKCTKVGDHERR